MTDRALFQSLQVFRGLAAVAVVLHHAALSTDAFVLSSPTLSRWLEFGALGVDFFFVLSGFIICHAHADDPPSTATARSYFIKRLIRVFPAYLPISIFLMLAYLLLPGLSASGGREYSIASSLFLLPASAPPALSVAWTLVHEMVFYTIFLIYFFARRLFPLVIAAWAFANLLTVFGYEPQGWTRYLLSPLNLEFIFGMLVAAGIKRGFGRGLRPHIYICMGVLTAIAAVSIIGVDEINAYRVVFGLGMALLVFGVARLDLQTPYRAGKRMLLLGSASYAIYLVHNPLLSLTQRGLAKLPLGWLLSCVFGVVISLLAGIAYHRYVETPALGWIRRLPVVVRLGQATASVRRQY